MESADKNEYMKEWYKKNAKHRREYMAEYRKKNKVTLATQKHKRTVEKDPDYEYKKLQSYLGRKDL